MKHFLYAAAALAAFTSPSYAETIAITGGKLVVGDGSDIGGGASTQGTLSIQGLVMHGEHEAKRSRIHGLDVFEQFEAVFIRQCQVNDD